MKSTDYFGLGLVAVAAMALYMYLKNNSAVSGILPGPAVKDTYEGATGFNLDTSTEPTAPVSDQVNTGMGLGYNVASAWQGGTGTEADVNTFKWLTDALFPSAPAQDSTPAQTGPAYPGQVPWTAPDPSGIDLSTAVLDTGSSAQVTKEYVEALMNTGPAKPIAIAGIVDTGADFGGMNVVKDSTTGAVMLQNDDKSLLIGPDVTARMFGCGDYNVTGLIFDASTQQCHDLAWFKAHQPGLVQTWGL